MSNVTNQPHKSTLNDMGHATPMSRHVLYTPPCSQQIAALVHAASTQLSNHNTAIPTHEVVSGLTSFLTFVADRLAHYASNGHQELVAKNRRKRTR